MRKYPTILQIIKVPPAGFTSNADFLKRIANAMISGQLPSNMALVPIGNLETNRPIPAKTFGSTSAAYAVVTAMPSPTLEMCLLPWYVGHRFRPQIFE